MQVIAMSNNFAIQIGVIVCIDVDIFTVISYFLYLKNEPKFHYLQIHEKSCL